MTRGKCKTKRLFRYRWRNTLKNFGYNLLHNFGHSQDTLSTVLVTLNLLAFAMHGMCDMEQEL